MANCESSALNFSFKDMPPSASFLKQHIDPSAITNEDCNDCLVLFFQIGLVGTEDLRLS